ncbi:MAG: hypothetical protein ACKO04_13925 [Actinomycetes bacterium]
MNGRFAAGYVTGNADAVDAIRSVRLMAGKALLACRTLVQGDRDGVSCDIDPEQPDCPRREYVVPEARYFAQLVRLGVVLVGREKLGVGTASTGEVVLTVLSMRKLAYRMILGDASCADGGGKKLAQVSLPGVGFGVRQTVVQGLFTVAEIASFTTGAPAFPATCVDSATMQVLVR